MLPEFNDGAPPFTVSMHVTMRFSKRVTVANTLDEATDLVKRQVEIFVAKAKAEALETGFEANVDYMVSYPSL